MKLTEIKCIVERKLVAGYLGRGNRGMRLDLTEPNNTLNDKSLKTHCVRLAKKLKGEGVCWKF